MDSGVRSGTDVVRALALGAQAAFAGKAFLWGLGALGAQGPKHVIDLLAETLNEEKAADEKLTGIAETIVNAEEAHTGQGRSKQ